jgi:hypothetical protein
MEQEANLPEGHIIVDAGELDKYINMMGKCNCSTSSWVAITPENPIPERLKKEAVFVLFKSPGMLYCGYWSKYVSGGCFVDAYMNPIPVSCCTHYAEFTKGAGE